MNLSANHATFTIVRDLPGSPRHAFRFWSEIDLKRSWNSCHPDWTTVEASFDFRMGGSEVARWRTPDGEQRGFRAHYFEIVPGARIIYAYEMTLDSRCLSTSLATVEFAAKGAQSTMTFTEQAVFLDGDGDPAARAAGTEIGFERLVAVMEQRRSVQH